MDLSSGLKDTTIKNGMRKKGRMAMLQLKSVVVTQAHIDNMFDTSWFTHSQIFDDVLLVSNKSTNCIVLKTTEGLILIDAIFPKKEMFDAIVAAIEETGWNPAEIKKFVITHGHFDHCGCGKWVKEAFHPETYMSKIDYDFWAETPFFPDKPETWKDFDVEHFVGDGDSITLGDKTIQVYFTPGHTPGGLSFIFPVTDLGVRHMAALWGGTNPPNSIKDILTYFKSLDYFMEQAERNHVDVAISNHPFIDNSFEKMEFANKRLSHMPNVYILGEAGYRHYAQIFKNMCYARMENM